MHAFEIIVHPTHLMIPSDQFGYTPDGNNIKNIAGRFVEFEYQLGQRPIPKQRFMLFDKNLNYRIFPRHALDLITSQLDKNGSNYKVSVETGAIPREVEIPINPNWKERDYQVPAIEFLLDKSESMRVLDLATGKGKALIDTAKIKIPGGWEYIGNLKPDDKIVAWDGNIATVTGVYPQGIRDVWEIEFADSRKTLCDAEHLWKTYTKYKTNGQIMTTEQISKKLLDNPDQALYIDLCKSEKSNDLELPIDPYSLGVLLGCFGGKIDKVTTIPIEVWKKLDSKVSQYLIPMHTNKKYVLVSMSPTVWKGSGIDPNWLVNEYTEVIGDGVLNVNSPYLNSSHSQRIAILHGLMDSKKIKRKKTFTFISNDRVTSNYLEYLIRSVGGILDYEQCTFMMERKYKIVFDENAHTKGPRDLSTKLKISSVNKTLRKESMTCISMDHPDKLYITDDFIVTHNTSVAIKAASDMGYCTIVIVSGLMDQWVRSFKQNTLLEEDDIYVIQGAKSLLSLFVQPEYKPKVFIASADTLQNYVIGKHDPDWPKWDLFCEHYGIGFKITDEIHLRFWANVMLDLHTAIRHNAYLSATPGRSSAAQDRIFSLVFPQKIQYGQGQIDKYIDTHFYTFNLDLGISERRVLTRRGYAHMRYEKFLLKNRAKFSEWVETILYSVIDEHFIKIRDDHEKCLVFVATIDFADSVVQQLKMLMPTMDIRTYLGRDPETNLERPGIIISTHKSAGTGNDIANLVTCINTVSYQTDIQTRQQTGRLRKLASGKTPHMVDMANLFFGSQRRHAESRIMTYKNISKSYKESDIHG